VDVGGEGEGSKNVDERDGENEDSAWVEKEGGEGSPAEADGMGGEKEGPRKGREDSDGEGRTIEKQGPAAQKQEGVAAAAQGEVETDGLGKGSDKKETQAGRDDQEDNAGAQDGTQVSNCRTGVHNYFTNQ